MCYGDNNRSAMVRIPYGRLEFRMADAGCNPYLVHAALIAAGLDGVERELDPGEPQNVNLYSLSAVELEQRGINILPQNLGEALDALAADTVLTERIGSEIIGEFLKVKRMEWIEYSRYVTSWEVDRYIDFF